MTLTKLPAIIRRSDLARLGLTLHELYAMRKAGELEQIAPGTYLRPGELDDTTATLAAIALRKPDATICLLTALSLHELTDEIPQATDLALSRGERTLKATFAPIRWHSFDPQTFQIGRRTHTVIDEIAIGLYGPERTIIDAFRLRHEFGADLAHEALKRWLRRPGNNASELLTMAKAFPKARPALQTALEILL